MTIASTADLTQRVQDWLFGRSDLVPRIPDFITLFEAKANRTLKCRQMETRAVSTVDLTNPEPQFLALPPLFQTMRRVHLKPINTPPPSSGAMGAPGLQDSFPSFPEGFSNPASAPRLKFATQSQIDDLRNIHISPGTPIWFALFGSEMELFPVPDFAYQIEMVYRSYIPPLAGNTTNWLLALAPDAYLYGTLMETAPYLHEDDRIAVWSAGVQSAFADLNALSEDALFNAGPLVIRRKGRGYG
jgi:hypothetical protein